MDFTQISAHEFMLKMGIMDNEIISAIQKNAVQIYPIIKNWCSNNEIRDVMPPMVSQTESGKLYQGDCLALMPHLESDSIDLISADPPFNLNKLYPSKIDDNLKSEHYLKWCENGRWTPDSFRQDVSF